MYLRRFRLDLGQYRLSCPKIRPGIPIDNQIGSCLQMPNRLITNLIFLLGFELMLILLGYLIERHELMLEESIFGIVL